MPVIPVASNYLVNIYREKLFFMCTVTSEVAPLLVIEFLHRVVDVFVEYFQRVDEPTIKENFSTVYQVLEEMCDNGYPTVTESNSLQAMVAPPSITERIANVVVGRSSVADELPGSALSNVPWRRRDLKYAQNEIYFDIVEKIDCIINKNGKMITFDVNGEILCSCKLSGMPDLTLSFRDASPIGEYSLHPCVRYNRFEQDRVLSFVPPDGTFRAIQYRVNNLQIGSQRAPLYCNPQLTYTEDGGRIEIIVGSKPLVALGQDSGSPKLPEEVIVTIPFPKTVLTQDLKTNRGTVSCDESTKIFQWIIGSIEGDVIPKLSGSFKLHPGSPKPEEVLTLLLGFTVRNVSLSGLKIEDLSISNVKYSPYKGVRSTLKAGKFQIRT